MPTELRWVANTLVSCFHAVAALVAGRPTAHQTLTDALADPAEELTRRLGAWCLEPGPFLGHVVPLSQGVDSERELVRLALLKSWHTPNPAEEMVGELAAPLAAAKR